MTPQELIVKVSRIADTSPKNSHITVTDVSRVQSLIFQELSALPSDEMIQLFSKLLANGKKSRIKTKETKKKSKSKGKK
jgi:hypothetical protein